MKKSRAIGLLLVALLCATCSSAFAGFVNDGGVGELRVIGKLSGEEKAVGMGRYVAIRDAVRSIVPSDYAVVFGPGTDGLSDKRVNWKGGQPWSEVLADVVAGASEVSVEIDVAKKLVTLSGSQTGRRTSLGKSGPTENVWRIRNGDNLGDAFAAWGREANWTVFWEAQPLISDIDATIDGSFDEALVKSIEALEASGVYLKVKFYEGNRAVRIVEKK